MKYNTYLFDFDGTLVDSMPSYASAMLRILEDNNVSYRDDLIKVITPLGYSGTADYYIDVLGLDMPREKILHDMNRYAYDEYALRIPLKPTVKETLTRLKELGADLNILTASPHSVLDVCLKRLGIYELFTNVWSCDDFGLTKADERIYLSVATRLGKSPEDILFVDDNLGAVRIAATSGMSVCGIYDKSSEDYEEELRSTARYYVRNLSSILNL